MKFILIDAAKKEIRCEEFEQLVDARRSLGLGEVDHGTLHTGLAYVVDEFGLFKDSAQQNYWSFGAKLIAGNSVLYAYDPMGETVDAEMTHQIKASVRFYADATEVEREIVAGRLHRPQMSVNGDVTWAWPVKAPKGFDRS